MNEGDQKKLRQPQNKDDLKSEENINNEDNLNMKMTRLHKKTTSNWKQPDLEDRTQPELTQP